MNEETKVGFFQQYKAIILCLIPAALLLYFLINTGIIGSGLWLFLLVCPLIHIIMMMGMRGKEH